MGVEYQECMAPAALRAGILIAAIAGLVSAAPAEAAVTIGSKLERTPNGTACAHPSGTTSCTDAQLTLPGASAAPGGVVATTSGVVVRWRIKTGNSTATSVTGKLRVLRGNTGVRTGSLETIPITAGTYTFATRLPIAAGERLGVDLTTSGFDIVVALNALYVASGAGDYNRWIPPVADGSTSSPTTTANNVELLLNGDVEADADGDGFGDETQDLCPTNAAVQTSCPSSTPAPDTTKPAITRSNIRAAVTNRTVNVTGTSNEAGSLTATGTLSIGNASRIYRLGEKTRKVAAGQRATLKLKMSRRAFNALRRAYRRNGRKARVAVSLSSTDAAGNRSAIKRLRKRVRPTGRRASPKR
jgi:hypothetical protein